MLQVIKAEEVRDGEPRWWCPDDVYAARTLEWIVTGNLHTEWRREADAFTLAIVDRPAPTPTPAPGLDLNAVERAERVMTPGPWRADFADVAGPDFTVATCIGPDAEHDAAGIVALRNAAPALIAEVRALRANCANLRGELDMIFKIADAADLEGSAAKLPIASLRAEIARLTAELCAEQDKRSDVIRERNDAIEEARNATAANRILKAAVPRLEAEVARLTAELAAARAVPADVEAAIETHGDACYERGFRHALKSDAVDSELDAAYDRLHTAIARAISDATAAGLTIALKSVEAIAADSAAVGYSEDWRAAIDRVLTRLRAVRENGGSLTSTCDATAARGTVGGLLATAPVGAIVEFWHGATANQITTRVGGIDDRVWLWRYRNPNGEWSPWDYEAPSPDDLSQPGEIVPDDPNQRGPLPKGG